MIRSCRRMAGTRRSALSSCDTGNLHHGELSLRCSCHIVEHDSASLPSLFTPVSGRRICNMHTFQRHNRTSVMQMREAMYSTRGSRDPRYAAPANLTSDRRNHCPDLCRNFVPACRLAPLQIPRVLVAGVAPGRGTRSAPIHRV